MTRHVATPEGAEFYNKPIGTPLGKAEAVKAVVQVAKSFAGQHTDIRRFEKTSSGWDAMLRDGRRVAVRSSDGTGKVGSRKGGWSARRAGLVAHGDTREEAVRAWVAKDAVEKAQWAAKRAAKRPGQTKPPQV